MPSGGGDLAATIAARAFADPTYTAIVIAHPCSGTTWFCDMLTRGGVKAAHELVRPMDPTWRVLVTFRQIGWTWRATEKFYLTRDPHKVLISAAGLYGRRPRVREDVVQQIIGCGLSVGRLAVEGSTDIDLAARTWLTIHEQALRRRLPHYRVEDARELPVLNEAYTRLRVNSNADRPDRGRLSLADWHDYKREINQARELLGYAKGDTPA